MSEIIDIIMAVALSLGLSGSGMVRVAYCESTLRPGVVSVAGYRGLYQLGAGHMRNFYAAGWNDWTDPYQMTHYVGNYVKQNGWSEWPVCGRRYYG